MYAAEVLTELKLRDNELTQEKIDYLASILTIITKLRNEFDYAFVEEAVQEFYSFTYSIMQDSGYEHDFILKLINYFESDNVSRLDNTDLLPAIMELLDAFCDAEDERIAIQVGAEHQYITLIERHALTSNNYQLDEFESPLDKEAMRSLTSSLK